MVLGGVVLMFCLGLFTVFFSDLWFGYCIAFRDAFLGGAAFALRVLVGGSV